MNFKFKITPFVVLGFAAFSQKVDLDKYFVTTKYRHLPEIVVDTNYKSFSVNAPSTAELAGTRVSLPTVDDLYINGLKKINNGDGHFVVKFNFVDARLDKRTAEAKKNVEKAKDGTVIKETTVYKPLMVYSLTFVSELFDYKGNKIATLNNYTVASKNHYPTSTEYSNSYDAESYLYNNYRSIFKQVITDEYKAHISSTNDVLNKKIGLGVEDYGAYNYIWMNDTKKHPEYEKQQSTVAEIKSWAAGISGDMPLSEDQLKKANEFLDYFESLKKKYTSEEKADKKMRYSAFYNKAYIYMFYLDNPTKAYEEASGLIANDYDTRDGKEFQNMADNLKKKLDTAKKKTRHFAIDVESVKGPNE